MKKVDVAENKKRGAFEGFNGKDWIMYYTALNQEKPVEDCGLELTDEEKERYINALKKLKEERKRCPEVDYEIKYSWFE